MSMLLSVAIPVYNEEQTIDCLLDQICSVKLPEELHKEIIIVNDGSTDQTAKILEKYKADSTFRIFNHDQNLGKTAAIKTAIEKAEGDFILIQDADLEYTPDHYPQLIEPLLNENVNIVYGSRFKGSIKKMRWINRAANIISCLTFNSLYKTKLSDINTCFKVFRKEVLKNMDITSSHFAFETEITAKMVKSGNSIYEVPIDYVARTKKDGKKITWTKALDMYMGIFKYR